MTMRTPLGRARGLGTARSGTEHFWWQRVTSVAAVPLTVAMIVIAILAIGADYDRARRLAAEPLVAIVTVLFVLTATYHMCIGMQVIIEDYVHGRLARPAWLTVNILVSIAIAVACIYAVLKISFGG